MSFQQGRGGNGSLGGGYDGQANGSAEAMGDMASGGSGSNINTNDPSQPWRRANERQRGVLQQLTERERRALEAVKDKVQVAKRIGALGGAALTFALIRRRAKPPGMIGTIAFTVLGGIAGGGTAMPLGVYWGRKDMQSVEDPTHFAKVIQGAIDQHRGRVSPAVGQGMVGPRPGSQPGMPNGPNAGARPPSDYTYPSLPSQGTPDRSSNRSQGANSTGTAWGDNTFDDSALYQSNSASSSSASTGFGSNAEPTPTGGQAQQDNSRWSQIRGQREPQGSSWDRLRQQDPAPDQRQRGAGSTSMTSGSNDGIGMADPTFGKGISPARAQAQREYEASFEREKRGIDG